MPIIIFYAVELAELERFVGSRDPGLLREARELLREDEEADWEEPELEVLDQLLERVIQEGRLYEGLSADETYYLTQLLVDLFDEFVESEAVSDEELPLEALDQALGHTASGRDALRNARKWLIQGRLLGTDRPVWDRTAEIEDLLPYFGYVRLEELAAITAAVEEAARTQEQPGPRRTRGRGGNVLKQLATACRDALESERDLLSYVS